MRDLTPKKKELEPIEIASIDEIKALQLVRLTLDKILSHFFLYNFLVDIEE